MNTSAKNFLTIIIVIFLILSGIFLVKRKKQKLEQATKYGLKPIPVRVTKAKIGNLIITEDYLAVIEPVRTANISSRIMATIEKVLYDEGNKVKQNETLITLDSREIRNEISSLQAEIEKIYSDLAANQATVKALKNTVAYWKREAYRDKTLAEKGDIPASHAEATADKFNEFNGKLIASENKSKALKHMIDALKKKQEQLKTRLSYCNITSPYNGIVTRRFVDPGDLAIPGKSLMIIEDRSQMKLSFDIPQQDIAKIQKGEKITFIVNGQKRFATLSHLYPSLEKTRMLRAEAILNAQQSAGLSSGEYIPISVTLRKLKNVMLLPTQCIIERPEHNTFVFMIQNGKLVARKVTILASTETSVAIKGIKPNEQVVTNTFLGWATLSSGKNVEIIK